MQTIPRLPGQKNAATDERRVGVVAFRRLGLAPLALERQAVMPTAGGKSEVDSTTHIDRRGSDRASFGTNAERPKWDLAHCVSPKGRCGPLEICP